MKHLPLFAWTAFSPGAPAVLAGAIGEADEDVADCDGCAGAGAAAGCAVGGVKGATEGVVGGETAAGANCVRGIVGWVIFWEGDPAVSTAVLEAALLFFWPTSLKHLEHMLLLMGLP